MLKYLKDYVRWCWPGVLYTLIVFASIALLSLIGGCMTGHNVYSEHEIAGIRLDLPIGEGSLGFSVGSEKVIRAFMRGGASFESSSSNAGGLFSLAGGQSKITQFKSNAQLNEGYLTEVLCSTNVPMEVKVALATNLATGVTAPFFPGSILQTADSTIHIGKNAILSNNVEAVNQRSQGLDRLVDRTADVIGTNVINQAFSTTSGMVHDLTNPLEGTVKSVNDTITNTASSIKGLLLTLILVIIGAVLIVSVIAIVRSKREKAAHKILIDAGLDDASPEDSKVIEPTSDSRAVVATDSLPGLGFFGTIRKVVVYIALLVGRLLALVPPQTRQKVLAMLVNYWKTRKAEKQQAKEEAKKQK